MKRLNTTQTMPSRVLAHAMALVLAVGPAATYAVRPALATEATDYAAQRDEANARAEVAEQAQDEANEQVQEANRERDEASSQADEAARQQQQANGQASNIQTQMVAASARLDQLFVEFEQAQAELSRATYDLEQTQQEIEELSQKIEGNEDKLDEKKKALYEQVNANYRVGQVSLLDILLESSSIDQMVSRVVYANRISEKQVEAIRSVNDLQEELQSEQEELLIKEAEQASLVEEQEEKAAAVEQAQQAQSSYVSGLNSELVSAFDAAREAEAEESRLRAQVAQAEVAAADAQAQADASGQQADAERAAAAKAELERLEAERAQAEEQSRQAASAPVTTPVRPTVSIPYTPSEATGDQRTDAVNAALSQVGIPYGWGCEEPGVAFDCNSLTHWAWAQAGVEIPYPSGHYCYGQFQWMQNSGHWVTDVASLQPGDLVFYSYDGGYTTYHVALYIGGGQVVHANGYRYGVMVSSIFFDDGFCGGGSPI